MIKPLFSPTGRTNRSGYLSIFLLWLLGSFFVVLVGSDLRQRISVDILYLVIAPPVALLAWLQICAVIRRCQDLHHSWLTVLPWVPVSVWSIQQVFSFPLPDLLVPALTCYCVVSGVLLLFLRGKMEAAPITTVPQAVAGGPLVREPSFSPEPASAMHVASVAAPVGEAAGAASPARGVIADPPATWNGRRPTPTLVAWLVAATGAQRGQQYHLHVQLGAARNGGQLLVLPTDGQPVIFDSATMTYDPVSTRFSLSVDKGQLELNGYTATQVNKLAAYDQLRVGDAAFVFVPLCGEYHHWAFDRAQ